MKISASDERVEGLRFATDKEILMLEAHCDSLLTKEVSTPYKRVEAGIESILLHQDAETSKLLWRHEILVKLLTPADMSALELLEYAEVAIEQFLRGELIGEVCFPCAFASEFSERILRVLCDVGFGETITYSELGARVGAHQRAVARVMASNKIVLLYPCHRVIAKSGNGGYSARGGVDKKLEILAFEASIKSRKT